MVGTSATTFDPGAKVTGYQLLVMLLRTLGYGKAGTVFKALEDFELVQNVDGSLVRIVDGYNWAKGYINYCQNAGIVVGTSSTTFDPGAKVTGYQLLVMLLRTLGYGNR
mgnify:CR=1 FL=1